VKTSNFLLLIACVASGSPLQDFLCFEFVKQDVVTLNIQF